MTDTLNEVGAMLKSERAIVLELRGIADRLKEEFPGPDG